MFFLLLLILWLSSWAGLRLRQFIGLHVGPLCAQHERVGCFEDFERDICRIFYVYAAFSALLV
jgi:hypothetical protein